jgi:hypothetical protein
MDMIFTGKTDWQLYFRLFCYELMLGIEVDGYSHEFLEVYEKDGVKTVWTNWDCCFEI